MLICDKNYGSNLQDCPFCTWWDKKRGCCGRKGRCMFKEKMAPDDIRVKSSPCDGCPYGVGKVCIGWCTRRIIGKEAD